MASLWWKSFPRVAVESSINDNPVLGSNRGGLPEALGKDGLVFDIPAEYTPTSDKVPAVEQVRDWVQAIDLWEDPVLSEQHSQRCLAVAAAWRPELLFPRWEEALLGVCPDIPGGAR